MGRILTNISDLEKFAEQAVIINVGTKLVATLALMSALKYAEMPVLMIECESQDGSLDHFVSLQKTYNFDLLSAPLKPHGQTLDWLFQNIPAENVLLIDSDLEITSSEIISMMKGFISDEMTFGCGFVHGPYWLTNEFPYIPEGMSLYQERPYIPLTMLKTALVQEALQNGYSFVIRSIWNDFAPSPKISLLLHHRFHHAWVRHNKLTWLNVFKGSFYGHKPSLIFCDTGADLYQFLKYKRGYEFVGYPQRFIGRYANHFEGITRRLLDPNDHSATALDSISLQVQARLAQIYNIHMEA